MISDIKREINIDSILYQVGDKVNLPFNEKGEILSIDDKVLWGHKYNVLITESEGIFNEVGDIVQYKSTQFI